MTFVPWRESYDIGMFATRGSSVKLRIAVADDEPGFLNLFVSMLQVEFDVIAASPDGKSALESISAMKPDVAVLDLQLPVFNGIELMRRLQNANHRLAVVICSVVKDPDVVKAALEAGASAYVWKERIATDLVQAVKSAAAGRQFVSEP